MSCKTKLLWKTRILRPWLVRKAERELRHFGGHGRVYGRAYYTTKEF